MQKIYLASIWPSVCKLSSGNQFGMDARYPLLQSPFIKALGDKKKRTKNNKSPTIFWGDLIMTRWYDNVNHLFQQYLVILVYLTLHIPKLKVHINLICLGIYLVNIYTANKVPSKKAIPVSFLCASFTPIVTSSLM